MKRAKKVLVFLLVLALTHSMSLSAFAASDKSNNGNGKSEQKHSSESVVSSEQVGTEPTTPAAWTLTVHRNLYKFESPDKKGGKILIPKQAIEHQLGVIVNWNEEKQIVTISKDDTGLGTVIVFGIYGITSALTEVVDVTDLVNGIIKDDDGTFSGTLEGAVESGVLTGTVGGTITDAATGEIKGTLTGTITDPDHLVPPTSVSWTLSGTLTEPVITQETPSDAPVLADMASGHAYVPLKYLSEIFSVTQPALITSATEGTDETTAGEPNDTTTADTTATASTE